jgi:hypothetical protein
MKSFPVVAVFATINDRLKHCQLEYFEKKLVEVHGFDEAGRNAIKSRFYRV